jgi:uncharacterized delta-60 repeat protein
MSAAGGALDPTFGIGGKVVTDLGPSDWVEALALQRDGKLVVAGVVQDIAAFESHVALARYDSGGRLDATFAGDGKVVSNFGSASESARAVAIQPDGRIVVAGTSSSRERASDFLVARYNADGALDTSFGSGGKTLLDFSTPIDVALAVALQSDGKIVVVGGTRELGSRMTSPYDLALARFNPDGTVDTTFGTGGRVVDVVAGTDDLAYGVALQSDGKIVAAGARLDLAGFSTDMVLARYNTDGSPDSSFDLDGRAIVKNAAGEDVEVASDGRILVAGWGAGKLAVFQYTAAGNLDARFGRAGIATADLGADGASASSIEIQRDGEIVVAGSTLTTNASTSEDFVVARFNPNGSLDAPFGAKGVVRTDLGARTFDEARGLAIQADGRIAVAGVSAPSDGSSGDFRGDFAVARYLGNVCSVPKLTGKTLAASKRLLKQAHCGLGTTRKASSGKVQKGRVIRQSPAAGRRLTDGARVNLIVSRGRRH